jgi:hypothetical protein
MELPKDIQIKLALELSPKDLINLCLASKGTYEKICDSKDFWRQKLQKDYPKLFYYYQKQNKILLNPKNTYIRKFTEISKEIENYVSKYFPNDQEEMYNEIYHAYNEMVRLGDDNADKYRPSKITGHRLDYNILMSSLFRKNRYE